MATDAIAAPKPSEALAAPPKAEKLITVSQGRPPYPTRAKEAFGITPGDWLALVDAVFPSAKTTEAIELALSYCRARNLDVFKRPVHIVPIWNSKLSREVETVWPGIGELRTTAARTGLWAGCDEAVFGPVEERTFKGTTGSGKSVEKTIAFPSWCSIVQYRMVQGQRVPFPGPRVFWLETYATMGKADVPNEMWETRPYGQLEKCAEAASLRRAFPEEIGDYIPEEMGRREKAIEVQVVPEGGSKSERLAAKLAKPVAAQAEASEEESQEKGDEGPGEALSAPQVKEVLALIEKVGVSLDDVEGEFGGRLDQVQLPGMDAKALEAEMVAFIRLLAERDREGGTVLDPTGEPNLFEAGKRKK